MGILYSKLKVFKYPEKLDSLLEGNPVLPPIHVRLKPTNVCCHRCAYCCYRNPDLQLGQDMNVRDFIPWPKMQEIISDLAEMKVKAVTFSGGGEPFVYPYLLETVGGLLDHHIKVASLTNGSRLTGGIAELFAFNATWLRISIDGYDPKSYAKYRGVGDDEFAKVMQNILNFQALGGSCRLGVCINVDADNAAHVYGLIKLLVGAGVKSIKVTPVIVSNDAGANYRYHKPHVKTVARQVEQARGEFSGIEISNDYKAGLASFLKPYTTCPGLQIRPVIGADQVVYSCQDKALTKGGELFSIREQSFREGWLRGDWREKINPARDCSHHCQLDGINRLVLEYLDTADTEFV